MKVVIIGAGNLGLVCAARMAAKGVEVTLLTTGCDCWTSVIAADDCNGLHFEGPFSVSHDPACVSSAELILLCLPGNVIDERLATILPHLRLGTPVMSIFSGDGFFFIAEDVLGSEWPVLGFQRVPFIARTKIPHRLGGITGYKNELFLAHRNVDNAEHWRSFCEQFTGTKTSLLDNFYEAALVNSNVVLHPARLMSLQKQIDEHGPFTRMPLFYEEWDDEASVWAIRLDMELRALATAVGACVEPLLDYYESYDASSLSAKMQSISAFRGIASPVGADGLLDRGSRYVASDVRVGLRKVVELAEQKGVSALFSREVLSFLP